MALTRLRGGRSGLSTIGSEALCLGPFSVFLREGQKSYQRRPLGSRTLSLGLAGVSLEAENGHKEEDEGVSVTEANRTC